MMLGRKVLFRAASSLVGFGENFAILLVSAGGVWVIWVALVPGLVMENI